MSHKKNYNLCSLTLHRAGCGLGGVAQWFGPDVRWLFRKQMLRNTPDNYLTDYLENNGVNY